MTDLDIVDRAKVMMSTIRLAQSKNIGQAYPDTVVENVVGELVAEVERLRETQ